MRPCQEKVLTLLEQNTLCQKDAAGGERVERKRVGDNGKGKRGSEVPTFLLFPPSNERLLFFIIAVFIGIPSESLCRGERTKHVAFCFSNILCLAIIVYVILIP